MVTSRGASKDLTKAAQLVLKAYFGQQVEPGALEKAIATLEVEGEGFGGGCYPTRLDAAVASVLLAKVRDTLPNWVGFKEGSMVMARGHVEPQPLAPYDPTHLFTLNWADSAPGFSWPTAYYGTLVPEYEAVVITGSDDSPDAAGFTDYAIGHFPAETDLVVGAEAVIVKNWNKWKSEGQMRWDYLFDEGLVTTAQANQWADEVWTDPESPE